jgi:hypothetical protein
MSIPSYQFASLEGDNIAKRRVMVKAKKGFETEEQRAVKSGKIDDNIKNVYRSIISNLELQLTTITVAEAFISTMAYEQAEDDVEAERELHSYLIGSLGKLVSLASTLYNLISRLGDEIVKSGNPANPSVDIGKIFSLMDDVDNAYGEYGKSGLNKSFAVMVDVLSERGQPVPQLDGLLEIFEVANFESRTRLEKIQRNEYGVELQSIKIPIREGRTVNQGRRDDIATGAEQRNFSKAEYQLLVDLKKRGLLRDDDFTSVYSGEDDRSFASSSRSGSSGTSYYAEDSSDEGDSDDDTMSRSASSRASSGRVFRPERMRRNYFDSGSSSSSSGSGLYTIPHQPRMGHNMASGYAVPLRYY